MCKFPAVNLLKKRREAADMMVTDPVRGAATIQAIDEARWNHQSRERCDCWERAREANPWQPQFVETK